jgi:hypothetical protein
MSRDKGERMSKTKTIHVEPSPEGWTVKEGSRRSGSYATKAEAVEAGRRLASQKQADQVIHNRQGRIEERNSYRREPFPPARERK